MKIINKKVQNKISKFITVLMIVNIIFSTFNVICSIYYNRVIDKNIEIVEQNTNEILKLKNKLELKFQ
ncbi:TPA: hypothetical protein ACKONR_004088 [Clostridioides difficile]|uniref:hypothetical protein n=1 Tax=Clostridioides difficile TaxID=1496 RepID=UPI000E4E07CE|nr:hypothetical protein [Clostridioides difficile]AXU26995.1 hypothetical protein CDIF102859_01174 [Clostridioides difficile]AXU29965.1 hypothetical protein CDIF102860_00335 [Clostridioides difficile]AXU33753.1 hypothetical protein CDIF102978_00335 [Clostridioides difficile]MDC9392228.1 hypothetical protein [Clostridioides difficile]MDK1637359.1 hypothetical protein [Clostridioides difficile]